MSCRLIDARFPDYKVVIPNDNPYKLVVNKPTISKAHYAASVCSSNKSTNQVALNISGSELETGRTGCGFLFEGNERMKCQYDGEDLTDCL